MTSTSPGGAVLEVTTVARDAPPPARDRHGRVLEGADEGRDDVTAQLDGWVEDDDDRPARASDPDVQCGGGTQPLARVDDLGPQTRCPAGGTPLDLVQFRHARGRRAIHHDDDRCLGRCGLVEGGECPSERRSGIGQDENDRGETDSRNRRAATERLSSSRIRIRPSSATSGGLAGERAKSVPRSTTFHPAASISALSRSASAQSRARRARPLARVPPRARRRGCGFGSQQRAQPIGDDTVHVRRVPEPGPHSLGVLRSYVERVDDPRERKYVVAVVERHAARSEPRSEVGVGELVMRRRRRLAPDIDGGQERGGRKEWMGDRPIGPIEETRAPSPRR